MEYGKTDYVFTGGAVNRTEPVSILTHPCGRVQRRVGPELDKQFIVSILTHPCGRVHRLRARVSILLRATDARCTDVFWFQSSPTLAGGCNENDRPVPATFQSSPTLAGGCNHAHVADARSARCRFNPHPPLRAGATPIVSILTHPCGRVQPGAGRPTSDRLNVSILTHPCGRVQRPLLGNRRLDVSILTHPCGRVQPDP